MQASGQPLERSSGEAGITSGTLQARNHQIGQWKASRQPRALDPVEPDQARDPVGLDAVHREIGVGAVDLRPDAGVGRLQRILRQTRPKSAHALDESRRAGPGDRQADHAGAHHDAVDPFHRAAG